MIIVVIILITVLKINTDNEMEKIYLMLKAGSSNNRR